MNNKNVKWESNIIYKQGTPRMTVIAAINYGQGVVIASDSQATIGNTLKRVGERKITEIEGIPNLKFNFAGAGDERLLARAKEQIISECMINKISTIFDFKTICENVVKFIKKRYVDDESSYPNLEFFTGVSVNNNIALFRLYPDGIASNIYGCDVIGSGWLFAEYIYSRLNKENLSVIEAANIDLYVVEEVKKIDPNCGGETTMSVLSYNSFFKHGAFEGYIGEQVDILQKADNGMKSIWQKMIRDPGILNKLSSGENIENK